MKNQTRRELLVNRFRSLRRSGTAGIVLSLSTITALAAVEKRHTARIVRDTHARTHTDDTITGDDSIALPSRLSDDTAPQGFAAPYALTLAERAEIAKARPGARSLVFFAAPVAVADEPLPEGFAPSPVAPFVAVLDSLDETDRALADAEGQAEAVAALAVMEREIAAVGFESDLTAPAHDYAPAVVRTVRIAAPVAVAPVSEFDALRAAFLAHR